MNDPRESIDGFFDGVPGERIAIEADASFVDFPFDHRGVIEKDDGVFGEVIEERMTVRAFFSSVLMTQEVRDDLH